jgi:predicted oxidoreductase
VLREQRLSRRGKLNSRDWRGASPFDFAQDKQTRPYARGLGANAISLVRRRWNLRRCGDAFGVVGGAEENNNDGEIHPDHYADGGGQAAVN